MTGKVLRNKMELMEIGLLLSYFILRFLPFMLSFYLIVSTKSNSEGDKHFYQNVSKLISIIISVCLNAVSFWGMHFYCYKDFEIIDGIEKVLQLDFDHQDIEYFVMSVVAGILLSVIFGLILRRFFCDAKTKWILSKKQEFVIFTAGFSAFGLLVCGFRADDFSYSKVTFSEICSNNETFVYDGKKITGDYVELQNAGIFPCYTEELYLSDDPYNLQKKPLGGQVIPAGGVIVIPCIEGVNSFSISNKGETIYLSNGEGEILEQVKVGELENETAYVKNSTGTWEIGRCTPGEIEASEAGYLVEVPVLSHASGFYDTEFELMITSAPETVIYYTLDGSIPDEGSYIFENGIRVYDKSREENRLRSIQNTVVNWQEHKVDTTPVPKAFLVRAMAMDNAGNKSEVVTATYFIGLKDYTDRDVISLIANPEDLFGGKKGILVTGDAYDEWYLSGQEGDAPKPHFRETGREWEREAVFEIFEKSESILQQDAGIRVQGASAREQAFKRLSIYARDEYDGSDYFANSLFGDETKSHSLLLRESFADVLFQKLLENRDIPMQHGKEVSVFLNGEYWYDIWLREKYDEEYFENYYGIEDENLILFKRDAADIGYETDSVLYKEVYDYVQAYDFTEKKVYEEFGNMVDIANYIDFLCANIYCANMDVNDIKNVVMWRSREAAEGPYNDGRWRFALYDMDAAEWTNPKYYGVEETAAIDSFSQQSEYAKIAYNEGAIYKALKQNPEFQKQFVLTFMDLLNTNFSIGQVKEQLEGLGSDITWLDSFFVNRPAYMKEYVRREFDLTGSLETVMIYNEDESKGCIQINTAIPVMQDGSWSGEYFTDYPVTFTAIPADGYTFAGWSGSIASDEITIEVPIAKGGMELRAEFQKNE